MDVSNTPRQDRLDAWAEKLSRWLFVSALPLWSDRGSDRRVGGFHEELKLSGAPTQSPRRARVQGRQSFVFSLAGKLGWDGPWAENADRGLTYLKAHYLRPDGLYRTLVHPDGRPANDEAVTYDQAFVLLAAAQLFEMQPQRQDLPELAYNLADSLKRARKYSGSGFVEAGERRYLSNPHMHLLEASLAWMQVDDDPRWSDMADEIVGLALDRFIDKRAGVLHEYFDADWNPVFDRNGASIEPGHQFEWAWLLERWARIRPHESALAAARTLFDAGRRSVDQTRNVALDEVDENLRPRRNGARFWPQTERLKAALILMETAEGGERQAYAEEARAAADSLWRYLQTPLSGLWRDKMLADGSFVDEPAPASSLYHIIVAIAALRAV